MHLLSLAIIRQDWKAKEQKEKNGGCDERNAGAGTNKRRSRKQRTTREEKGKTGIEGDRWGIRYRGH